MRIEMSKDALDNFRWRIERLTRIVEGADAAFFLEGAVRRGVWLLLVG